VRDLVDRESSGLTGGLGSESTDFLKRFFRSSLGRREPRPSELGELKRLVRESRLIDGFKRRSFHEDFLDEDEEISEGGEFEDVEVFGDEVAGLVGVDGGIMIDAASGNVSRGSSRICLMRASRFRVVSEVQSDVETRSVGRLSRFSKNLVRSDVRSLLSHFDLIGPWLEESSEFALTASSACSSSALARGVFGPVVLMKLIRSTRDRRLGLLLESSDHKESPPKLERLSPLGRIILKVNFYKIHNKIAIQSKETSNMEMIEEKEGMVVRKESTACEIG